jgi:hypothetical protein
MKHLFATSVLTSSLLFSAVVVAAPAEADLNGGSIVHGPDEGYDAPIRIRFAGESSFVGLPENTHSDHLRPNGQEDVQEVKLRILDSGDREEILCQDPNGTGYYVWHGGVPGSTKSIGNFQNLQGCVIGLANR